jgi:hypothetical protein
VSSSDSCAFLAVKSTAGLGHSESHHGSDNRPGLSSSVMEYEILAAGKAIKARVMYPKGHRRMFWLCPLSTAERIVDYWGALLPSVVVPAST